MNLNDIKLGLTGDVLVSALDKKHINRKVIAEDLIYENTCLMVAAEPGCGKSTVSTQVAMELAAGLPVFGYFHVPRPMKVLYSQQERHISETLERVKVLKDTIPLIKDNLVITDEYQKLDLLLSEHKYMITKCIQRDCPNVDVIFFDPIYAMVRGGLSKDEPASAFAKAMSFIEKETGAAIWLNHHTTKDNYDNHGNKYEKDDPFYGSQWIKAHVTGSYFMKKNDDGVRLINKKDNYSILAKEIVLEYDPDTEYCTVEGNKMPAIERVKNFIRIKGVDGKEFTFSHIKEGTNLSARKIREILVHTIVKDMVSCVSGSYGKKIYKFLK